jgi:hypothetical protein
MSDDPDVISATSTAFARISLSVSITDELTDNAERNSSTERGVFRKTRKLALIVGILPRLDFAARSKARV